MNIAGEIKYFLGDNNFAQLKFTESKTSFSIDIVSVPSPYRNQGIGGMLIDHILLWADTMNKDVYVSARPLGSSSEARLQQLTAYYRRFGFEIIDTGLTVAYMCRKARHTNSK
ncbi:MAG: GNAT family N-acetyltransferase [Nitrospirae bacterium]|nr:GNAT family N-acetyltransferase [Nitrospirota bacterium]